MSRFRPQMSRSDTQQWPLGPPENQGVATSNLALGTHHASRISDRVAWGLVVLGLLLLFFVLPHDIEGDGRLRLDALQAWLSGSGIPSTKYPLVGSLLSIPLFLLGRFVGSPEWWVSRYNVIVYAAGLVLLYRLLRDRLDRDILLAFLLLLGTTAMVPSSLTGFGTEPFTVMAAATGLAAWSAGRWKTATALLGLAVANVPATIVGVALAMGWWAWRVKRIRALAPVVVGAGLWLLENLVRRKSALLTGYEGDHGFRTLLPYSGLPGFSYPIFFGVLLLSVWVGIDGQVFSRFAQDPCSANHYSLESLCWYVPEFSVLWTPFVLSAQVPWWGFVLIAYAIGVSGYVALPLIRDWATALYR